MPRIIRTAALCALAGGAVGLASARGAAAADLTYKFNRDYAFMASCGYDKIENFRHNGPVRHAEDIAKADLPSRGEIRISASLPLSASRAAGWEIRFLKSGPRSTDVVVRRANEGIGAALAEGFYTDDIPRLLGECAAGR